ncbi:MAG: efflux RND transporter permease subunit [Desulfobacterales bacterium]|nr:efflux RND transporter permease subunit [Desulfobacterales bacterium]
MRKIIHFLINQKLLINLLVMLLLLAGYFMAKSTNREAYPEVNFDMVSIKTTYPGGSPDELEQLISIPIEKKLREVDGIDKVRTYNIENVSVVVIYLEDDVRDKKQVVQDIKDAVDLVDNFPEKAETPIVEEIKIDKTTAIDVALFGKVPGIPYGEIREAADVLEDFLYEIDGVAEVEDFGYYDKEFLVEVNPESLGKYRIGLNTIINTLKNRNLDLPGGSLRIGDKEYILRTKGQYENTQEIEDTVIMANDAGFITRIKDVANVSDTFEEADVFERFHGRKGVILRVWKKRSADEIVLVDRIKKELADYKITNSENVALQTFNDTSRYTRNRLSSVQTNAISGFFLLAFILFLLLGPRVSAIVTCSIPIAFMTAFFAMKIGNITFNVISLFGMIMVLGMIVDFGIVVAENSHRYMQMGVNKTDAIEKGVSEVFWPVTVTLLCICAAFAPLLLISGIIGKFIRGIPIILMICLGASWFIAMFIMPTYLNIFSKENSEKNISSTRSKPDQYFEKGRFGKVQKRYQRFLAQSLKHRYVTLAFLIGLLFFSLFMAKFIGFVFIPSGGAEELQIKIKFPQETNLQANLREMRKIETIILKLPEEELTSLHCTVGSETSSALDPKPGEGTHKSTILIYLTPEDDRKRIAPLILDQLRNEILEAQKQEHLSGLMKFEFSERRKGPPIGKPVNVEIRGNDFATLKTISNEYMDYLKTINGVRDISLDLEEGKEEYRYVPDEVIAARTDVSVMDIAQALNASFEGAVATSVRQGKEDIDIRVRFPEDARMNKKSLDDVMISNGSGGLIPLERVTHVKKQPGYTQINRLNYKRIVQVQAEVDTDVITSIQVNRLLAIKFKDIEKRYTGYSISYGGEQEETGKRMGEMGVLFLFAILVIYIILAVYFNSLMIPVVVMSAIPFALVGVMFALWIHGQPLSFMSTLGLFSLAGVIVSNTLVLVQFINYMRDEKLPLNDALIKAGVLRLRPVILTSGTTVLGLFPTIYGLAGKDYFVAPLALSFGYGLIFATFITLVLVPCFYHIAEDVKGVTAKLLDKAGIQMGSTIYRTQVKDIDTA